MNILWKVLSIFNANGVYEQNTSDSVADRKPIYQIGNKCPRITCGASGMEPVKYVNIIYGNNVMEFKYHKGCQSTNADPTLPPPNESTHNERHVHIVGKLKVKRGLTNMSKMSFG